MVIIPGWISLKQLKLNLYNQYCFSFVLKMILKFEIFLMEIYAVIIFINARFNHIFPDS